MPKTKYPIFKCLHRGQKGFTLIELLIVIGILGAIAAGVILNLGRFTSAGGKAALLNEINTVQTAVDAAMADATMSTITTSQIGATSGWKIEGETHSADVDGFLRRAPTDSEFTLDADDDYGFITEATGHGWTAAWNDGTGEYDWTETT